MTAVSGITIHLNQPDMKLTVITLMLSAFATGALSQTNIEQDLKKFVLEETQSYRRGDSVKWASLYSHADNVTRAYSGNGFHSTQTGWKNFGPYIIEWMRNGPIGKRDIRIQHENLVFRNGGDLATMSYTQKYFLRDRDSLPLAHTFETRTLIREKGNWKIVSVGTIDSMSYATTDAEVMENIFNMSGYTYFAEKKYKEAIEVFKLNVTLFPNSWNVYDSLGEAYAADGNKELAIKNYERSIELNAKNDIGKEILKKLKGE
jgi:tetratricopeptide (TPR) repeat protein